jgi:hypothetical protein
VLTFCFIFFLCVILLFLTMLDIIDLVMYHRFFWEFLFWKKEIFCHKIFCFLKKKNSKKRYFGFVSLDVYSLVAINSHTIFKF